MPRDWQNLFIITSFRYIEVLFNVFYYYWGKKKIVRHTEDFISLYEPPLNGRSLHRGSTQVLLFTENNVYNQLLASAETEHLP